MTPSERRWDVLSVLGPTLAGLFLRLWSIGSPSFWADELHVIEGSRGGLVRAVQTSAEDVYPPLHYAIASLLPVDGVRVFSALCGAATVAVTALLARRLSGQRAAWVAGLWLALAPAHVHWSQEARSYSLQGLLHVLLVAAIFLPAHPAVFGWLAAAFAYTHGLGPVWIAGIGAMAIVLGRRDALLGLLAGAATFLPWVSLSASQTGRFEAWNTAPEGTAALLDFVRYLGVGHSPSIGAALSGLPLIAAAIVGVRSGRNGAAIGVGVAATLAMLVGVHLAVGNLMGKHLTPLLPALAVLAGVGAARLDRAWAVPLLAAPCVGLLLGLQANPVRFDHAGIVNSTVAARSGGPVAATTPGLWHFWMEDVDIAPLPTPLTAERSTAYFGWQRRAFAGRADVAWWWLQDHEDVVEAAMSPDLPVVWSVTSDATWGYALALDPGIGCDLGGSRRTDGVTFENGRRLGFYANGSATLMAPASGRLRVWATGSSLGERWPQLKVTSATGAEVVVPTARVQHFDMAEVSAGEPITLSFDDDANGLSGDLNVWVHRVEVLP